MRRVLQEILVFVLAGAVAAAQLNATNAEPRTPTAPPDSSAQADKQEILQRIAFYEAAARSRAAKADPKYQFTIYESLGNLYQDMSMNQKAEDAMKRAIAVGKGGSQLELAEEVAQLAVQHVAMKKLGDATRDLMLALKIREGLSDPVGIAHAWDDLAGLYDVEHKYKEAASYAQKAYDVFGNAPDTNLEDQIGVRETLGYALTGMRSCGRGIEALKDAIHLSESNFSTDRMKLGYAEYVLGMGYWHCDDRVQAAEWLERGTTRMRSSFGWDQGIYLNAMTQSARFLRQDGQVEAAASAEAVVNQANAVVDVRSLSGMSEGFRPAKSK